MELKLNSRAKIVVVLTQAIAEKASIDEIYLDVTSLVEAELADMATASSLGNGAGTRAFGW